MGYRIEYDIGTGSYEVRKSISGRLGLLTSICFGLFLLLSSWFWPEGIAFIRDLVIPGDDAVTIQAFQNLTQELGGGAGIREAVAAFCNEVIRGNAGLH